MTVDTGLFFVRNIQAFNLPVFLDYKQRDTRNEF